MISSKKILYRSTVAIFAKGFDANFYIRHYGKEFKIRSKFHAVVHYVFHGKFRKKFPNEASYISRSAYSGEGIFSEFDLTAYKFYNKDLVQKFEKDEEFFTHYFRHGHSEERICRFPDAGNGRTLLPPEEKWKSIFVASEFLSFCGEEIPRIPLNGIESIDIFYQFGIEKNWPISFEYAFDAKFLRDNKLAVKPFGKSDEDLYRDWLTRGFSHGVPPNEQVYLASYIGREPFPEEFDWRAFIRRSGLSHKATRSQTLIALFEGPERKIFHSIDLMGKDAARILKHIGCRSMTNGKARKAVALFERSVAIAPAGTTFCLLGDAHHGLGNVQEALDAYVSATDFEGAPLRAFLLSASINAARNDFSEAFKTLRKAHGPWRKRSDFHDKLNEVVQLYFEHQSAVAHSRYRGLAETDFDPHERSLIDDFLSTKLEEIRRIYEDLGHFPASTGGDPGGYIAILANHDLKQCTHYRIEQKVEQFDRAGIAVKVFDQFDVENFIDALVGARAAIFYRVAATPDIIRAITYANRMGMKTYYEVDDLIFDSYVYPDPLPSFEGQVSAVEYAGLQFGVPLFRYAMSLCWGSIASTPALAKQMQAVTRTDASILIRNGLDGRNQVAITMGANPIHRENIRIRIFYGSGTKAHNADFNRLVAPVLGELMHRYAHVDLVVVGHLKLSPELSHLGEGRIICHPFIADIDSYWSILASSDINLAVLEQGLVADCKSEIKWLEAAVLRLPSIVSDTQTYREVIEDGVDGFVAASPAEWRTALQQLIEDSGLRAELGENARNKVLRNYDIAVGAQTLKLAFENQSEAASPSAPTPLRVLICNVFFAPQSHGGATRVVEENVRSFRAHYPDLEVAIFCSEERAATPGGLTMGSEDGIPVYRLSVRQEVNMEWRPFNETHVEPFERVLDHFRPDIVHFHCIQRLTATVVEVTLRREVPYVITLHDAWWISDDQFLIDNDGILRLPTTDILADSIDRPDSVASMARRQRLTSLLQNSSGNLSVSAPFADVYAKAGVASIRIVENGVPALPVLEHVRRVDGRIALGHVGGRTVHKGAVLIEATLRRGDYGNLHLTMVDGSLDPGESIDTFWGTTPVTLTAPVSQADVAKLYSGLDVLLAPSTWPESFGLVTREALHSGLWVIASDLGAIGQDVEEENGYVIDVSTTAALRQVLEKIDTDPTRYRNRPPVSKRAFRRMDDQAAELHAIYREICPNPGMNGTAND